MPVIDILGPRGFGRRLTDVWKADRANRAVVVGFGLLAVFVVMGAVLYVTTGWSSLPTIRSELTGRFLSRGFDSWRIMIWAVHWWQAHPGERLYQEVFFNEHVKFQYPPSSLLPLMGLEAIGLRLTLPLLNGINYVFAALIVLGMGLLTWLLQKRTRPEASTLTLTFTAFFASMATLAFYPITMALYLGQIQVWINALFLFACIAWLVERRAAAGVLVGLICLLKPQFGLFALWGLLRRDWKFLAGLAVTGLAGLAISVPIFGVQNHLDYLAVLQFLSRRGEAFLPNYSFNALLQHVLGNDDGLLFHNDAFPPFNPLVYDGTLITSAAAIIVGLLPARSEPLEGSLVDFQRAALAFTLASPITWEHHYGVAAPALVTLFCHALSIQDAGARRNWMIATTIAFVFLANQFNFIMRFANTPFNVLQSYMLYAGVAVILLLLRLGYPPRHAAAAAT